MTREPLRKAISKLSKCENDLQSRKRAREDTSNVASNATALYDDEKATELLWQWGILTRKECTKCKSRL